MREAEKAGTYVAAHAHGDRGARNAVEGLSLWERTPPVENIFMKSDPSLRTFLADFMHSSAQ